jgi:hypothetical protein
VPRGPSPWLVRALLATPALIVVLVGGAWWFGRQHNSFSAVRVFAGNQAAQMLAVRAVRVRVDGSRESPELGCIRLELGELQGAALPGTQQGAARVAAKQCTNDDGVAAFNVDLAAGLTPSSAFRLLSEENGALLAEGQVRDVSQVRAASAVVRKGGVVQGRTEGELEFEVGLEQGVLAVPFPGRVRVGVRYAGKPVAARLLLTASGAEVLHELSTDALGVALVVIEPRDFVVELELTARALDAQGRELSGRWFGGLPVVPGASWATIETQQGQDELVVRSPVARSALYVDWLAQGHVLQSVNVPLVERDGIATGTCPLPAGAGTELYAVVSSEPDLQAMALVGWPLRRATEPALVRATWDARAVLVLDGVAQLRQRAAEQGRRLRGWVFTLAALGALLEGVLFWRLVSRTRSHSTELGLVRRDAVWVWGILLCVALALLGLAALMH